MSSRDYRKLMTSFRKGASIAKRRVHAGASSHEGIFVVAEFAKSGEFMLAVGL